MANGKKPSRPQPPQRKKPASPAEQNAPPAVAPIDPAQSAAAAAAQLAHHAANPPSSPAPKTQSSTYRILKQSLARPHAQTIGGILDKIAPTQKRSGLPFASKQVGHNQTFGPDASRRNIPRRTNG